jgi:hypothetical protein
LREFNRKAVLCAPETVDNIISQSLAAQRSHVLTIVLEQGARLAVLGVMIGLAAAGLTRLMGAILYGVSATDPLTFVAVAICADAHRPRRLLHSRAPRPARRLHRYG